MKVRILIWALIPFIVGCAAFKQLEPDPEISSQEGKYIKLADDDDYFELDKGNKYYVEFPAPIADNFYLLINVTQKDAIASGFGDRFDPDKGLLSRIANEAAADVNEDVYSVAPNVQKFYWAIENVYRDVVLEMSFRYLPKWRYKFETQYETFQNILHENKVDRTTYENIGGSVSVQNLNFSQLLGELERKTSNLEGLFGQLGTIESLFPSSILNSQDEAYVNFVNLKEDINLEITFQKNYANALKVFQTELGTRNNMPAFADALPLFVTFYENKDKYPSNVIQAANRTFDARLDELTPYYEELVRKKADYKPIPLNIDHVNSLYTNSGASKSSDYTALAAFIKAYNTKAKALQESEAAINEINDQLDSRSQWPTTGFFNDLSNKLDQQRSKIPSAGFAGHGVYSNIRCATALNNAIHSLQTEVTHLGIGLKSAQGLVTQLDRYASQKDYSQMIQLINNNPGLKYLKSMYSDLDSKSLSQQEAQIKSALRQQNWRRAEDGLRGLYNDNHFLERNAMASKKLAVVKALEDTLLVRVERVTAQKVDAFVNERYAEVDNVQAMYNDPVFDPAWDITFASGSRAQLDARKEKLRSRLQSLKQVVFPQKAIEALYKDFSQNINNNGVMKARAIVVHGNYYKGDDRRIKNIVAECDPWAAKWITKEVEYRRIYAVPTTTNPNGENTYVFRINIRIPTDARFPAYDMNIKLPKAVASSGGAAWYDQMTMNKKVLKPEGRFTITSPNSANDYTALITPLQVEKDADSVLEVRFTHNSFKVFEVSVMAQKPILRKN